ncbi:hypothetical protein [Gulosibacter hominis]|uniref:hypothetical protein n=1 Tax=Gulosibacter hominis TaxID=2770504 RepID=UPI00191A6877|nr:hypothetical protein [Gulosibacter hominis]
MTQNETSLMIESLVRPIGPSLFELISLAVVEADTRTNGVTADTIGLSHTIMVRALARTLLIDHEHCPIGWVVEGQGHRMAQTILRHTETGITLRLLKESTVNPNGVPHAGRNLARRSAWSGAVPLEGLDLGHRTATSLTCLLLWKKDGDKISLRVVHTVEEGRYGAGTAVDLDIQLGATATEVTVHRTFHTGDDTDFFYVDTERDDAGEVL